MLPYPGTSPGINVYPSGQATEMIIMRTCAIRTPSYLSYLPSQTFAFKRAVHVQLLPHEALFRVQFRVAELKDKPVPIPFVPE